MKVCALCKRELPKAEFHVNRSRPDGRRYDCKECCKRNAARFYRENAKRIRAKHRHYYSVNGSERYDPKKKLDANRRLYERRMAVVREYKEAKGCERCEERHPATLDLHHRDPTDKHPRLTRNANGRLKPGPGWRDLSFADIAIELEKCEVLCANCHRKEEWQRRQTPEPMILVA